jgi:dipeptidyl aminopeptidase/acylaminoacyl peptidase
VLAAATLDAAVAAAAPRGGPNSVRTIEIRYRAHDGVARSAYVLLPSSYTRTQDPPIPLVISPHGRGVSGRANARLWGTLPARGDFAVVSPAGQGRKLARYSWGSAGQIDDLARMPVILHLALPWVHVDRRRVYAVGGSMGGQETLLLLARHPRLLAGAAAFDAVTRFALQYRRFSRLPCNRSCRKSWNGPLGVALQSLARQEIGGTPRTRPLAYVERSPYTYARAIAASCVPLQLWWSTKDRIVADQRHQSEALYLRIRALNPRAPVSAFVGTWRHSAEMRTRLPAALAAFGLLAALDPAWLRQLHAFPGPDAADCRAGDAGAA